MQELFEKIKERLEENQEITFYFDGRPPKQVISYDTAIEIVNQVEEEYQSTMSQVKCDASFSDGYMKALDDAIEKFLEYGCFMIQWNPKLSKENLVTDVLRQVKGQAVYNLEKMKQKAVENVNQISEKCGNSEIANKSDDVCEWIRYDYRTIAPKNHEIGDAYWRIPEDMSKLRFCPYCGKEIKVVE